MVDYESSHSSGQIGGVSLASFLQMLEQERKSCTLIVKGKGKEGKLYFEEGSLIDAECDGQIGYDAVRTLLSWENSILIVAKPDDRLRRINQPLTRLLLNAAHDKDEEAGNSGGGTVTERDRLVMPMAQQTIPAVTKLVQTIISIPGVKHYFIMNRKGIMIAQSSRNRSLGDFIRYCIVSGSRIRSEMNAKGPHQIRLFMDNGEKLLVIPGTGIIVGLLIDEQMSVYEVTERLRAVLVKRKKDGSAS